VSVLILTGTPTGLLLLHGDEDRRSFELDGPHPVRVVAAVAGG